MIPILHPSGRDDAWTIGADQPRFRAQERPLDPHHVEHRNALGDAHDQAHLGIDRLEDRIRGERGRHVDHRRVGAGARDRVATVSNTGSPRWVVPPLPGVTPPTIRRAVGDRLLGVERALGAGEALADDLGVAIDQNRHQDEVPTAATTFSAASRKVARGGDREARLAEDLLAEVDVGALEAHHQRHPDVDLARRGDDALGDHVAAHDAAEDVDQHALHLGIGQQQLERRGDPLLGGAAADVQEIGRRAAVQLDDVHGRHRQAGAVDHAADVAIQLDIVQLVAARLDLVRILLVEIAQLDHLGLAIERIAVEVHLGVEGDQVAVLGDHQRIDLDQAGVELGERPADAAHEGDRLAHLLALEAEAEGDLAAVERLEPDRGIDRDLDDLLRRPRRDLLDVDPALGRGHQGQPRGGAIDHRRRDRARGRSRSRPRRTRGAPACRPARSDG